MTTTGVAALRWLRPRPLDRPMRLASVSVPTDPPALLSPRITTLAVESSADALVALEPQERVRTTGPASPKVVPLPSAAVAIAVVIVAVTTIGPASPRVAPLPSVEVAIAELLVATTIEPVSPREVLLHSLVAAMHPDATRMKVEIVVPALVSAATMFVVTAVEVTVVAVVVSVETVVVSVAVTAVVSVAVTAVAAEVDSVVATDLPADKMTTEVAATVVPALEVSEVATRLASETFPCLLSDDISQTTTQPFY